MLHHGIGKVDAMHPEMLELLAHPLGRLGIVVGPEDLVGMAQARGAVVEAADKRTLAPVRLLDHAGLAVHEHVVAVARDDAYLHPAGGEQAMQALLALAREQRVEPMLVHLPARHQLQAARLKRKNKNWTITRISEHISRMELANGISAARVRRIIYEKR